MQPLRSECSDCPLGSASPQGCPFERRRIVAGTQIEAQGFPAKRIWFIRSGLVLLEGCDADGEVTNCALRGPGSLVGLDAQPDGTLPHDVRAQSDVEVCSLDRATFQRWLGPTRSPATAVLQIALKEAGARWEEKEWALAGAVERVARFLLAEHDAGQEVDAVPRQVLARVLGLRAETLSRALGSLRECGALQPDSSLHVRNSDALREKARLATSAG